MAIDTSIVGPCSSLDEMCTKYTSIVAEWHLTYYYLADPRNPATYYEISAAISQLASLIQALLYLRHTEYVEGRTSLLQVVSQILSRILSRKTEPLTDPRPSLPEFLTSETPEVLRLLRAKIAALPDDTSKSSLLDEVEQIQAKLETVFPGLNCPEK